MKSTAPTLIAIDHDDYHAKHVGRTKDGRQFFLTSPFVAPTGGKEDCQFVALYLFDPQGQLIEAIIDSLGPSVTLDDDARSLFVQRLERLGSVSFERIEVAPFALERFGTTFGLILRVPDEDIDVWAVELEPGNYMAFFEPWDSGDYDT